MKLQKQAGATSEIWQVFIQDSSSTTGAGLTSLTNSSAGLTAYYHRDTDTTATVISLVPMTIGTFTSKGFKEIDATNMAGWYQICPPDAAIAAGAKSCAIHLKGATNMAPLPIEVQLTAVNPDDSVRAGLTALPNAAAAVIGGLLTAPTTANVGLADLARILGTALTETAGQLAGGFKKFFNIATPASTMDALTLVATVTTYTGNTPQTGDGYARLGAPSGASVSADIAAVKSDTGTTLTDINTGAGAIYNRIGAPAGASIAADIAAAKVDTAAIKVQTDKLTFTVANKVDSNQLSINGDATSAANLAKTTRAIGRGTASGVPTTTSIPTSAFTPTGVVADQFKGRIVTFDADTTTTALRGQSTDITASTNAATPTLTVTALTTAPVSGDTFSVT